MEVDFSCKYCGSTNLVKFGTSKSGQYWYCKDCGHKFLDNNALPNMRVSIPQVAGAIDMHYRGMSIDDIRMNLDQQYDNCPSDSTVYAWIDRFTNEATAITDQYKPNVGDTWIADETMLDVGGHKIWFWDVLDEKTRFLLASRISFRRTTNDAQMLMEQAAKRAGKRPKVVVTDKLAAYLDGIELAFGADTEHAQSHGFTLQPNTNLIERFHGILKSRTKVMRGLKTPETAMNVLDGWLVHYNFFRPHESLDDKTPAEEAGITFPYHNWMDIVKLSKPKENVSTVVKTPIYVGLPTRKLGRKHKVRRHNDVKQIHPTVTTIRL